MIMPLALDFKKTKTSNILHVVVYTHSTFHVCPYNHDSKTGIELLHHTEGMIHSKILQRRIASKQV